MSLYEAVSFDTISSTKKEKIRVTSSNMYSIGYITPLTLTPSPMVNLIVQCYSVQTIFVKIISKYI